MDTYDVNSGLAELFDEHGIGFTNDGERLHPAFKHHVAFKLVANVMQHPTHVSSRMDVLVTLPDGREVCEAFGDRGEDVNAAVGSNFENFCLSSFHVMYEAFNDLDGECDREQWMSGGRPIEAILGPIVHKTSGDLDAAPAVPADFLNVIQRLVEEVELGDGFHFVRAYYAQNNATAMSSEFMIDNVSDEAAEEELGALNWPAADGFYSARFFAVIKA